MADEAPEARRTHIDPWRRWRALPARARDLSLFGVAVGLVLLGLVLLGRLAPDTGAAAGLVILLVGVAVYFEAEARSARARSRLSVGAISTAPQSQLSAAVAAAALERLPDPFILLDGAGRVALANRQALRAFGAANLRRHISSVVRFPTVLEAVDRVLAGGPAEDVEYSYLVPVERHYLAHVCPVPGEGEGQIWALILLHDLTAVKRVDQMRADFVANASHELRTPLSSLAGFIETLRGHARRDPEAQEKFLEIMQEQTARMRRLIDDLLSLSRIELNEHVPPSGEVDLAAVVRDVIDMLSPLARQQRSTLVLEAPPDLPPVVGERDELVQVFQNLIDNAIKYGDAGRDVTITLGLAQHGPHRRTAPAVFGAVKDQGEGIAREHLPRLTERFYRVDAKRSRDRGGTGLGLAIVKHIIARHRGSLAIDSKLGQGSTFTVFLPAAIDAAGTERRLGAAG